MGSKKWTGIGSVIGTLVGGVGLGTAIGAGAGYAADRNQKKKSDGGGVASGATQTEEEKTASEKDNAEVGESPFASGALATRKKRSTLVSGGTVGALSGAGGGSSTLGE